MSRGCSVLSDQVQMLFLALGGENPLAELVKVARKGGQLKVEEGKATIHVGSSKDELLRSSYSTLRGGC